MAWVASELVAKRCIASAAGNARPKPSVLAWMTRSGNDDWCRATASEEDVLGAALTARAGTRTDAAIR
jgi:hypothetical protein